MNLILIQFIESQTEPVTDADIGTYCESAHLDTVVHGSDTVDSADTPDHTAVGELIQTSTKTNKKELSLKSISQSIFSKRYRRLRAR